MTILQSAWPQLTQRQTHKRRQKLTWLSATQNVIFTHTLYFCKEWQHNLKYAKQSLHSNNYITYKFTWHGHQTLIILYDMLLAWTIWSMISRQQAHYMTYCWKDLQQAWSSDSKHTTWYNTGMTHTKQDLQSANTLHDILLARSTQSMVSRQ